MKGCWNQDHESWMRQEDEKRANKVARVVCLMLVFNEHRLGWVIVTSNTTQEEAMGKKEH